LWDIWTISAWPPWDFSSPRLQWMHCARSSSAWASPYPPRRQLVAEGSPTTVLVLLGIEIDTTTMVLRLDAIRLQSIRAMLEQWGKNRKKATVRQLQSLLGTLIFAARVVRPGRLFVARMLELLRTKLSTAQPDHYVPLSAGLRADIEWWTTLMTQWNGVAMIPHKAPAPSASSQFFTDASDWGYGSYYQGQYFYGE
jgi:hypothetical protein